VKSEKDFGRSKSEDLLAGELRSIDEPVKSDEAFYRSNSEDCLVGNIREGQKWGVDGVRIGKNMDQD
jgi:hypothetical protein